MKVYESTSGWIKVGLFGMTACTFPGGRKAPVPRWLKHRSAALHYGLKKAGYDSNRNPAASAMVWEYVLDQSRFPPNGIGQQAAAEEPEAKIVQSMVDTLQKM